MIIKLAYLVLTFSLVIMDTYAKTIDQKTEGGCSPVVNQTGGDVTINCYDLTSEIVERLNKLLDYPGSELNKKEPNLIKAQKEIDHLLAKVKLGSIFQKTEGWCSPAVNKTKGNVAINCHGVPLKIVKQLEKLIDKKDMDLIKAKKEIDNWFKKYNELYIQLAKRSPINVLAARAKVLLGKGELEAAEKLLEQSLAENLARRAQLEQEKVALDRQAAADAYDLGLIKELQLNYPAALNYYEKAASLTPKNTLYLNKAGLISV